MFCSQCGAERPQGAAFCPNCGVAFLGSSQAQNIEVQQPIIGSPEEAISSAIDKLAPWKGALIWALAGAVAALLIVHPPSSLTDSPNVIAYKVVGAFVWGSIAGVIGLIVTWLHNR